MPLAGLAAIQGGTSLIGALIGSNAAGKAADTQAAGYQKASNIAGDASKNALNFQNQQYQQGQQNQQPWLNAGQNGLSALQYGLGVGGDAQGTGIGSGSLLTPYKGFDAPTGLTMQNDPGYQARLALGTDALQKSAAARGSVLTGGTAKALSQFGQDYGSNEYGNVYNRALQSYGTNQNNYYTGQNNAYNRLDGLSQSGQQTATNMANQGQAASNNVTGNLLNTAQAQGAAATGQAAATASGYVGQANAWNQGLAGVANAASNYGVLSQLGNTGHAQGGFGGGGLYGKYGM